ncbi:hypothetical protein [Larkinella terrae]|uniref:Uncharacterized protein n=1 Tax=Larkinella terrae TaxID=2025311 RepID=A0A7K0EVG7_9BACT|nr:hypothetical protein [Larkinella terrae]MRS65810.1 hypothetical protein [Larkinella terrae]
MKRIALTTTYLTVIGTRFSGQSVTGRSFKSTTRKIARTVFISLILTILSVKAQASDDLVANGRAFDVSMFLDASKKVNLMLAIHRSRIRVTLKNSRNDVIHQEFLGRSKNPYRRKFNFEESKSGVYLLEVSDGKQTYIRQVEIVDVPASASQRYIVYRSPTNY